jgi:hypothetical protein
MADDAARNVADALNDLAGVRNAEGLSTEQQQAIESSIQVLQDVASMGECRRDVPYASMRPVLRNDGTFQWCCNHEAEHCV